MSTSPLDPAKIKAGQSEGGKEKKKGGGEKGTVNPEWIEKTTDGKNTGKRIRELELWTKKWGGVPGIDGGEGRR